MMIVDNKFKVDFFLDTNILVDYVQGENQLLVQSLDYLAKCPFVTLRSSHYVEFEFTEIRKKNEFFKIVHGEYPSKKPEDRKCVKNYGSNNWKDGEFDYLSYKDTIQSCIEQNLNLLKNNLNVNFDDHVLHKDLVKTTCKIVLQTKISREDSMVLVSCMYPSPEERLLYCIILTNDKQYYDAYNNSKECVDELLGQGGVCLPQFFCLKDMQVPQLRNESDIIEFWNKAIVSFIKDKNESDYVGHTIKPSAKSITNGHIWFDMEEKNKKLYESDGLVFISQDLLDYQNIVNCNKYYGGDGLCSKFPFTVSDDTEFSIKLEIKDSKVLSRIQNKYYYVFYEAKYDDSHSLDFNLNF